MCDVPRRGKAQQKKILNNRNEKPRNNVPLLSAEWMLLLLLAMGTLFVFVRMEDACDMEDMVLAVSAIDSDLIDDTGETSECGGMVGGLIWGAECTGSSM